MLISNEIDKKITLLSQIQLLKHVFESANIVWYIIYSILDPDPKYEIIPDPDTTSHKVPDPT
jgi:hypothetical protein